MTRAKIGRGRHVSTLVLAPERWGRMSIRVLQRGKPRREITLTKAESNRLLFMLADFIAQRDGWERGARVVEALLAGALAVGS